LSDDSASGDSPAEGNTRESTVAGGEAAVKTNNTAVGESSQIMKQSIALTTDSTTAGDENAAKAHTIGNDKATQTLFAPVSPDSLIIF